MRVTERGFYWELRLSLQFSIPRWPRRRLPLLWRERVLAVALLLASVAMGWGAAAVVG